MDPDLAALGRAPCLYFTLQRETWVEKWMCEERSNWPRELLVQVNSTNPRHLTSALNYIPVCGFGKVPHFSHDSIGVIIVSIP